MWQQFMVKLLSWGHYPHHPQHAHAISWAGDAALTLAEITRSQENSLAYGFGRSYGDSCLAASNHIILTQSMNRIIAVDWSTGIICAQAGLSFADLIEIILPHGWFLPVTPGTKYVSLGGAVANDVHGKNHHVMGTFGCHVRRIFIYRSEEGIVECSPTVRPELFTASIGGLGLTGVILSVELQLRRVESTQIDQTSIRFGGVDEFFDLSKSHDQTHEYTVAWIDCLAKGRNAGRGHLIVGNHSQENPNHSPLQAAPTHGVSVPFAPPFSLVNGLSLRTFNTLYYHRQRQQTVHSSVNYDPFFYPLDRLKKWNRMYGKAGFQQYQCVIPHQEGTDIIKTILREIAKSGSGSFLAVLKQCGEMHSPGLLSFPLHGVSLALDFPQIEEKNIKLFNILDSIVHEAGGRLYPAKDAHMSARHFQHAYPRWEEIETLRDPKLLSQFWQRVTQ
jgi:FAD/FMN-containing dehydrogenase